ncbi:hypothetical protein GCM10009431_08170 [Gaetbulibacter jejuensis]|uniref:Uncharacterized protein n=2 Tax=Gaetbulibacter jejuensis TaxID=584607 RepID=A0ABN1JGJ3_9FLAO
MDIVYDDFVRWENSGLLWDVKGGKHDHRQYSYVHYAWATLVAKLRQYGFDYDIIRTFKCSLSETLDNDFYRLALKEKRELLLEHFSEDELKRLEKEIDNEDEDKELVMAFEGFIVNVINHNDVVSLLFYHGRDHFYVPVSGEVLKEFEQRPEASEYFEYFRQSHVSISINEITQSFINNDLPPKDRSKQFTSILSEQEHNALKLIRKNYRSLKEATITTLDNQLNKIDLTMVKKNNAENLFIQYFKKGDYKTLEIKAVNGKVVYVTDKETHKL